MKSENILLIDLSARLRHGVICSVFRTDDAGVGWRNEKLTGYFETSYSYEFYFGEDAISIDNVDKIKPYLRLLSSITEEELEELNTLTYHNICVQDNALCGYICGIELEDVFDWLNAHHFDYRGLIKMGLALEAPEGMYV